MVYRDASEDGKRIALIMLWKLVLTNYFAVNSRTENIPRFWKFMLERSVYHMLPWIESDVCS